MSAPVGMMTRVISIFSNSPLCRWCKGPRGSVFPCLFAIDRHQRDLGVIQGHPQEEALSKVERLQRAATPDHYVIVAQPAEFSVFDMSCGHAVGSDLPRCEAERTGWEGIAAPLQGYSSPPGSQTPEACSRPHRACRTPPSHRPAECEGCRYHPRDRCGNPAHRFQGPCLELHVEILGDEDRRFGVGIRQVGSAREDPMVRQRSVQERAP